jgi:hypothetical protein
MSDQSWPHAEGQGWVACGSLSIAELEQRPADEEPERPAIAPHRVDRAGEPVAAIEIGCRVAEARTMRIMLRRRSQPPGS